MNWKTSRPPRDEIILVRAVNCGEETFAVTRITENQSLTKDGSTFTWHNVEGINGYEYENDFKVEDITHWCEITKPEGVA